ncbi:MAG: AbrB/MazE/SpoVT family DNA-binding domain-containing protein [Acidobacteria bacterium]|nr:AbrB/MazE/SpoVT family DNA-binding domain-containing protein [Acidobacteriota bacterium]
MSGTTSVVVGDKGRIVVPAEVRARHNWAAGTELILVETDEGLLLTERSTALRRVRALVGGAPLVDDLLSERRREAEAEDAAT